MRSRVGGAKGGAAARSSSRGCRGRDPRAPRPPGGAAGGGSGGAGAGPERGQSRRGRSAGAAAGLEVPEGTARGREPKPCSSHPLPAVGGEGEASWAARKVWQGRSCCCASGSGADRSWGNPCWSENESCRCFGRLCEAGVFGCRCVAGAGRDVNSRGRLFIITETFSGRSGSCWAKETLRRKRQAVEAALPTARGKRGCYYLE